MSTKLATILADFTTNLSSAIVVGGTTATLQSATDDDGIALPTGTYFFSIDGDNSSKEHIVCTLTGTALTAIQSVSRQGVEVSGAVRSHRIGATVSLTDFGHIKFMNDLLSGATTFNASVPLGYDGTASITTANQFATKAYVDGVAVSGAPNASTTVKGIIEIATQAEVDARTLTGGTGALLVPTPGTARSTLLSDYVADTGTANTYAISPTPLVSTYTVGQIFSFIALNANSGASTLNVATQGAKNIFNRGAALIGGEILANQMVMVEYDGTQFQLVSPAANGLTTASAITQVSTTGTAAESITAGMPVAMGIYQSDGGITLDTDVAAQTSASGGGKTIAFTVGNNANRILIVTVNVNSSSTPSMTYNGSALTLIQASGAPGGGAVFNARVYALVAPSTGANNLVIAGFTATEVFNYAIHSYYNAKQTSNPSTSSASQSPSSQGSLSNTITPGNAGAIIFSALVTNLNNTVTYTNMNINQAGVNSLPGGTGRFAAGDTGILSVTSLVTVSGSGAGTSDWAMASISIEPFSALSFRVVKASSAAASSYNWNLPLKSTAFMGFAVNTVTVGQTITVALYGIALSLSGLIVSTLYYLADTAGTIATTAGTISRKVGIATTTTTMLVVNEP